MDRGNGFFPVTGDRGKTQVKCAKFAANAADLSVDITGKGALPLGVTEQQAFLHGLKPQRFQESICRRSLDVVEFHGNICLLGSERRKTEG